MMINSQTIKLKKPDKFDNLWIEEQLSARGFDIIRWAIIEITATELIISAAIAKKIITKERLLWKKKKK